MRDNALRLFGAQFVGVVLIVGLIAAAGCKPKATTDLETGEPKPYVSTRPQADPFLAKAVAGARAQLVHPARYDGSYKKIPYPLGDVDPQRGACTDVVIRAFRNAGLDLQEAVQRDHRANKYPKITAPDPNIDHRRCPNLVEYCSRHGKSLALDSDWQPGDIVFWKLPMEKDHVGIVSDRVAESGRLMVVHNIGPTVREEDCLPNWRIVGHFRLVQKR